MIRFAIVVGHKAAAKGAIAVAPLSMYEYDYNTTTAALMLTEAQRQMIPTKVFYRDLGDKACYDAVNNWAGDDACSMELHFNAAADPTVRGSETLYADGDNRSQFLAKLVQARIVPALYYNKDPKNHDGDFSKMNRKAKGITATDRGHYLLKLCKSPTVIVEPFFGSNAMDCAIAMARQAEYAAALVEAARLFLSMPKSAFV